METPTSWQRVALVTTGNIGKDDPVIDIPLRFGDAQRCAEVRPVGGERAD